MPILTTATLEYKITSVHIDAANLTIRLFVSQGVTNSGIFNTINSFDLDINQEDTQALVMSAPVGATLYECLKTALYQYLIDKGLFIGTIG